MVNVMKITIYGRKVFYCLSYRLVIYSTMYGVTHTQHCPIVIQSAVNTAKSNSDTADCTASLAYKCPNEIAFSGKLNKLIILINCDSFKDKKFTSWMKWVVMKLSKHQWFSNEKFYIQIEVQYYGMYDNSVNDILFALYPPNIILKMAHTVLI